MNRGAEQLGKMLSVYGSKVEFARKSGIQAYKLSRILTGERKPSAEERAWIEDNVYIGWRAWDVEIVVVKVSKPIKRPALTAKQKRGVALGELRNQFEKSPLRPAVPRKNSTRGAA